MVIVPNAQALEVEAMVLNRDIGFVNEGQTATVKVDAFPFTRYGFIEGKLVTVSKDAATDEHLGLIYPSRLQLERTAMFIDSKTVELSPGMAVTVEADGFLDLDHTDNPYQLIMLRTLPYRYIELRMTRRPYGSPSQTTLADVPGFYQFSFAPLGDVRCADLEPHFDKGDVQKDLPAGQCLVATRRDVPVSRYETESSRGWEATERYGSYPFVQLSWHEIRDREQNAVIARAVRVRYATWLGARIGAAFVFRLDSTSGGRPIGLSVKDVIKLS